MLSGNMGAEFTRALAVKVPKSKYGFIEGIVMGQKAQAVKAKRGIEAEKSLDKQRAEAYKALKPDKLDIKLVNQGLTDYQE